MADEKDLNQNQPGNPEDADQVQADVNEVEMTQVDTSDSPSSNESDVEDEMLSALNDLPEEKQDDDVDNIEFPETGPQTQVSKADFQHLSEPAGKGKEQNIDLLLDVNLPISIELGRTKMSISDILALGPGSVVELNKLAGEPVDLLVNQRIVAKGEVVVIDENFGVRVTQLMTPEERLKALGDEA